MASGNQKTQFNNRVFSSIFLCAMLAAITIPNRVFAKENVSGFPTLPYFTESVTNGNADTLRGIYIANIMAYTVVQQPNADPGYVSTDESQTTQYQAALDNGIIGLLAHNYLAGESFYQIKEGDTIILIYGDGHTNDFIVEEIQVYQAISPLSPYSDFVNLKTEELLSADTLFNQVYNGQYHLTLQTCLGISGDKSWGRMFIIAKPVSDEQINTRYSNSMK